MSNPAPRSTTTASGCVTNPRTRSSSILARSADWHTTLSVTPSPAKSKSILPTISSASASPRIGRGQRLSSARAYWVSNAVCSTGETPLMSGISECATAATYSGT